MTKAHNDGRPGQSKPRGNATASSKTTPNSNPRYVIDSNCVIEGRNNIYAADVFPKLWQNLGDLFAKGVAYMPQAVIDEITIKHDDDPNSWINKHKDRIVAISEAQQSDIENYFGQFVSERLHKKNYTDLRIIATAKALGATVVTLEKMPGEYKIPTICQAESVKCISLMGLMQQEGWVFE